MKNVQVKSKMPKQEESLSDEPLWQVVLTIRNKVDVKHREVFSRTELISGFVKFRGSKNGQSGY